MTSQAETTEAIDFLKETIRDFFKKGASSKAVFNAVSVLVGAEVTRLLMIDIALDFNRVDEVKAYLKTINN